MKFVRKVFDRNCVFLFRRDLLLVVFVYNINYKLTGVVGNALAKGLPGSMVPVECLKRVSLAIENWSAWNKE